MYAINVKNAVKVFKFLSLIIFLILLLTVCTIPSASSSGGNSTAGGSGASTSTSSTSSSITSAVSSVDMSYTPLPFTSASGNFTIFSIGDSTMAYYDNAGYPLGTKDERRGWGQYFPDFITSSSVTFSNNAKNGRSSRDFYNDTGGLWVAVKSKLKAGDYVFIQFGHNDETYDGLSTEEATAAGIVLSENSTSTGRGTEAWGQYIEYLTKYVRETRALGANPILIGPIVRLGSVPLTATNCHNLTGNGTVPGPNTLCTSADYVTAMKYVAAAEKCYYIDMTASTKALVESYGTSQAKSIIYNDTDNTHLRAMGATMYAQLAAQELISKGILTSYLTAFMNLVVSPTSSIFGTRYVNTSLVKTFSVTGLSLTPASGNITITAPSGFTVCNTSNGTFTSNITIPYTGGILTPTNFYICFTPTSEGSYSSNVSVAPASGTTVNIAVSGSAVAVPVGGTESYVNYQLNSSTTGITGNVTGLISCTDQSLTGLNLQDYYDASATNSYIWNTAATIGTIVQRTTAGSWPAETTPNAGRYVQFAVTPSIGFTYTIDTISLFAGGAGGNGVGFSIQYSTNSDFSSPVVLETRNSGANVKNTLYFLTYSPGAIIVNSGQTFYLRIFPWNSAAATGKYLLLQNVTIHGTAQ